MEVKSKTGNFERFLKANGLEMEKLKEVDKYHPGFMRCVVDMAENPEAVSLKYSREMVKRAGHYLRNKRKKANYVESDDVFGNSALRSSSNMNKENNFCVAGSVERSLNYQASRAKATVVYYTKNVDKQYCFGSSLF